MGFFKASILSLAHNNKCKKSDADSRILGKEEEKKLHEREDEEREDTNN